MTPLPLAIFIEGMKGLGDNLYQRAVVRELGKARAVFLKTPWPQLYADLSGVYCVRSPTMLRTQARNAARPWPWVPPPRGVPAQVWHYARRPGSILGLLCDKFGVAGQVDFSGPPVPLLPARPPYVLVRPVTLRKEWRADSREADPAYIARAAAFLRARGFRVVSVADISPPEEWALEPLPEADEVFHRGELPLEQVLALVAGAAAVVGGVGWLAPAAVAYRVPMFLIFGGWGNDNGPQRIFDPRMDTSRIHRATPDRFCMCSNKFHACNKTISDLDGHLERFAMELAARQAAAMAA